MFNYILGLNKTIARKLENHRVKITLRNFLEICEGILTSLTYNKIWKIKETVRKNLQIAWRKTNSATTNLDIEVFIAMHFTFVSIVKAFFLKCWQFVTIHLPYFKSTQLKKMNFLLKPCFDHTACHNKTIAQNIQGRITHGWVKSKIKQEI